jgi:hypothetical protein
MRNLRVEPAIQALTMQPSTGQTATHCGLSNWPSHSVHLAGSMTKVPPFSRMAVLGHSGSQAEHPVHVDAMIFIAMTILLMTAVMNLQAAAVKAP